MRHEDNATAVRRLERLLWHLGARSGEEHCSVPIPKHTRTNSCSERPRAREIGVPFEGLPGPHNAITDVPGVEVGHCTLVSGEPGPAAVRTGVTAVLPRGPVDSTCFAATFSLNGAGEMTGSQWVDESGMLYGPVMITNTHSVGAVRDAVIVWQKQFHPGSWFGLPVVAETYDGFLSDIDGASEAGWPVPTHHTAYHNNGECR